MTEEQFRCSSRDLILCECSLMIDWLSWFVNQYDADRDYMVIRWEWESKTWLIVNVFGEIPVFDERGDLIEYDSEEIILMAFPSHIELHIYLSWNMIQAKLFNK